jgi:hypothetical protein
VDYEFAPEKNASLITNNERYLVLTVSGGAALDGRPGNNRCDPDGPEGHDGADGSLVRLLQIARAALHAIGRAGATPRGGEPPARPAGAGVYSGWIGPDGRVEEAAGTAIHVMLLARFGESSKAGFFAKGAVRYVDATDHVSLELMGQHVVALGNAIDALARRWADTAEVDLEFLPTSEVLQASSAEVRQALGRRLQASQSDVRTQSR